MELLNDLLGFENENEKFEYQKEILSLKFIKVIENYLNQNNISQAHFAKMLDCSPSYISQIFSANKFVNMDFLVKTQNALEMPFEVKISNYDCRNMDIVYNANYNRLKTTYNKFPVDYSNEELLEG